MAPLDTPDRITAEFSPLDVGFQKVVFLPDIPGYMNRRDMELTRFVNRASPYRISNEDPEMKRTVAEMLPHRRVATVTAADNPVFWSKLGTEKCDTFDISITQIQAFTKQQLAESRNPDLRQRFLQGDYRLFLCDINSISSEALDLLIADKDLVYLSNILDGIHDPNDIFSAIQRLFSHLKTGSSLYLSTTRTEILDPLHQLAQQANLSFRSNEQLGLRPFEPDIANKSYHIDAFMVATK